MAEVLKVGDRLGEILVRLRGAAADGPISTGHLLFSITYDKQVAPLLDAFDITRPVVLAVLTATTEPAGGVTAGGADDWPVPVTTGAAAALRAAADDSPATLLVAMLGDPGSQARAMISECGVDPDEVRTAVRDGRRPNRPDRVAPELRPARDALLGRVRYRGRGLRDWVLFSVLARQTNHAARPVLWARLEADERAREQGRTSRTDDVLLALLVTHEVAAAYPHMARNAMNDYGAGRALLAQGLDHEVVRGARLDAEPDEVPAAQILRPGPDWTEDTSMVLARLVAHRGNRAAQLLDALRRV